MRLSLSLVDSHTHRRRRLELPSGPAVEISPMKAIDELFEDSARWRGVLTKERE